MTITKAERRSAYRAYRTFLNEDLERERRRDLMYAEMMRVFGPGGLFDPLTGDKAEGGKAALERVAAKRAAVKRQGDPLHMVVKPCGKAERREARHEGERRRLLLRGTNYIRKQAANPQSPISQQHVLGSEAFETIYQEAAGGSEIRAIDWRDPVVDGGGLWKEPVYLGSVADADRALRELQCIIGLFHFYALCRICGDGESIQSVANDYEMNAAERRNGASSTRTREHVSRLLEEGLRVASRILPGCEAAHGRDRGRIVGWNADDDPGAATVARRSA